MTRAARIPRLNATASEVRAVLRLRYPAGTYALLEEVGNGTGFACNRHADAVAVGLWPSRGLFVEGIEIKVDRGDWLKELRQPKKADDIAKWCDFWWVAAGSDDIVREGELPPNWGLLVLQGQKLKCKKQAPKLEPAALDRAFVAAMFRRAHEGQVAVAAHARRAGFDEGVANGPDQHQRERDDLAARVESLRLRIERFEEASGVAIDQYNSGEVGKALREFMTLRGFGARQPDEIVARAAQDMEEAVRQLRDYETRIKRARELVGEQSTPTTEVA